jgi:hypothetical protein
MGRIRNIIPKPQRIPVTEPRTTPGRVKGPAAIDFIVNQNTIGQFAKPPFPSSKGAPWASPSGDPRAAVTGAARREELLMKRKVAKKNKSADKTLNKAQPGSDAWLRAFEDRYPGM